jgi:hypothetical protein
MGPGDVLDILDKRQNFSACRVSNLVSFIPWQSSSSEYPVSAPRYSFVVPQTWSYRNYIHIHTLRSRDSIVDILTRIPAGRSSLFDILQGENTLIFPKTPRLAVGPSQSMEIGDLVLGRKAAGARSWPFTYI